MPASIIHMEMYNMKTRKSLLALLAAAALSSAGAAYAGPPVAITFKHVGATGTPDAVYTMPAAKRALMPMLHRSQPLRYKREQVTVIKFRA